MTAAHTASSSYTTADSRSTATSSSEGTAQILVVKEPPTRRRCGKGRWCGTQFAVGCRMDVVAQAAAATVATDAVGHQLLGRGCSTSSSSAELMMHIHCDRLRGAGGKSIAIGRQCRRPGQFAIARIAMVVIWRLRLLAVLLQESKCMPIEFRLINDES